METGVQLLSAPKKAAWRNNIKVQFKRDCKKLTGKVCDTVEKLSVSSKDAIGHLRVCGEAALRQLDGRAQLANLDTILRKNFLL